MHFDQRHLTALFADGLITELPYELGPFPVVATDRQTRQDLIDWNIVDPDSNALTRPAADLFSGITNYDWALSGLLLLYSERRPIQMDIPDEFVQMGLQYSIRDIPRVGFLIGYRAGTLTTLTVAAGNIAIATDAVTTTGKPNQVDHDAAQIILNICDPQRRWKPYPMPPVAIPSATAHALRDGRQFTDPDQKTKQIRDARRILSDAKMAATASDELAELMTCDNIAAAQIGLTVRSNLGRTTALNNALGLLFFTGTRKQGMVVSYPTRSIDGSGWINYESATPASVAKGVAALRRGITADNAAVVSV